MSMKCEKEYEYAVSAAGRVNIIGEHIDYCGGQVLPVALSLKNTVYIRRNGLNKIRLAWSDIPDKIELDIDRLGEYRGVRFADYFAACAYILREEGVPVLGCDVLSDCEVPFGSGLSSSAAIEVSFVAALLTLAGERVDPVRVALAALRAEREYVGVNCGVMDQYASACGRAGQAMLLNCANLSCDYIPVDLGEYTLVVANTNKPHSLVESKYNERRSETETALAEIRKILPIESLAELSLEEYERVRNTLYPVIEKRVRHVVTEVDRVRQAAEALRQGDAARLGALLKESHASLRDLYEVTGRELDALTDAANAYPSCLGSRMTGAGFGGSAVAILRRGEEDRFKSFVTERYEREIGYPPTILPVEISDGIVIRRF